MSFLAVFCVLFGPGAGKARASEMWPELSSPAPAVGGGENDAAVVVGVEGYAFVPPVPGAESNAKLWHQYLTETRGLAPQNVKLLTGVDATREEMLEAAQQAASRAGPKGTLWFVFIGHGAPSADGKDGLLVGVDAQQKAARDKDWEKLSELLPLEVVPAPDKTRWAAAFVFQLGKDIIEASEHFLVHEKTPTLILVLRCRELPDGARPSAEAARCLTSRPGPTSKVGPAAAPPRWS